MFNKSQRITAWTHVNAILDALDALEEVSEEAFEDAIEDRSIPAGLEDFLNAVVDGHNYRAQLAHLLVKHGTPQ